MSGVTIHIAKKNGMVEEFAELYGGTAFHGTIWDTIYNLWGWGQQENQKYPPGDKLCSFMINGMYWTEEQHKKWWREWKNPQHPLHQRVVFVMSFDCPFFKIGSLDRVIKALEQFWEEDIEEKSKIRPTILDVCDRLKELQKRSDVIGFFVTDRDAEYFDIHENRLELPTVEGLAEVYLAYSYDFITLEDIREDHRWTEADQVFLVGEPEKKK